MSKFYKLKDYSNLENTELGDFAPEVIFEGYSFGDRTLEGCYFKATWSKKKNKYIVNGWWDKSKKRLIDGAKDPYYCTLNEKYWFKKAEDFINDTDCAESIDYEEVWCE